MNNTKPTKPTKTTKEKKIDFPYLEYGDEGLKFISLVNERFNKDFTLPDLYDADYFPNCFRHGYYWKRKLLDLAEFYFEGCNNS